MTQPITVTIKRRLPSQNLWNNKRGMMGSLVYKKERNVWYALMRAALTPKEPPTHKVHCKIISFRSLELDDANMVGGANMIPDALVNLGYLKDDKPRWFSCEYEQRKCKRSFEYTIIHIQNP